MKVIEQENEYKDESELNPYFGRRNMDNTQKNSKGIWNVPCTRNQADIQNFPQINLRERTSMKTILENREGQPSIHPRTSEILQKLNVETIHEKIQFTNHINHELSLSSMKNNFTKENGNLNMTYPSRQVSCDVKKPDQLSTSIWFYTQANTSDNNMSVNLEDLVLLEDKFSSIMKRLEGGHTIENECIEWWNCYFNSSLCGRMEYFFRGENSKAIVRESLNIQLLTIILCYDTSYAMDMFISFQTHLQALLNILHRTFFILCEYFVSKVSNDCSDNIWVSKIRSLILKQFPDDEIEDKGITIPKRSTDVYIESIKNNNAYAKKYLRMLIKNSAKRDINDQMIYFYRDISSLSDSTFDEFFITEVLNFPNKNAPVLPTVPLQSETARDSSVPIPYLQKDSLKEFTLVLDLDETLIHLNFHNDDPHKGTLIFRPGLIQFLNAMSQLYELVVFTAATQEYADPIIDAIEQESIFFDYRLYREHAVILDNDFVKDLSNLGRDLSKVIVIDNKPQNFRLQKENGILIKEFMGEDFEDTTLIDMIPVLVSVANEKGDVRKTLQGIRNRISSNIGEIN